MEQTKIQQEIPEVEVRYNEININLIQTRANNYEAGNIKNYEAQWKDITSDKFIIDIIRHGLKINFFQQPPEKQPFE